MAWDMFCARLNCAPKKVAAVEFVCIGQIELLALCANFTAHRVEDTLHQCFMFCCMHFDQRVAVHVTVPVCSNCGLKHCSLQSAT